MAISTAFCTSAKTELLSAGHCFQQPVTYTGTAGSASTSVTSLSGTNGLCVGMAVTGTSIAAGTVLAAIGNATATLSKNTTGIISGGNITFTGDTFKIALIQVAPAGTYNASSVNYSDITGNTDEVTNAAGAAYVVGGQALTNVAPAFSGVVAYTNFSNPSWSTATFSTSGCMIYNSSARVGGTGLTGAGRAVSVHDFGGTQQVSGGTFTVLCPANTNTTALLRLG